MKKLYKYLEKIGIQETTRNARYYEEKPANYIKVHYGSNYFYNTTFIYTGIIVTFEYPEMEGTEEEKRGFYAGQMQKEKMLKKYCKKYGYSMEGGYFYGDRVFTIRKTADIEKAEIFYIHESASVKECEEIAHKYYTEGTPEKVNNALLRPIMERHEKELNEHLQAIYGEETKTA